MSELKSPVPPEGCALFLDQLEPYLDGDLEAPEAEALQRHLDGCAACGAELEMARAVMAELSSLPILVCPPEVLQRVDAERGRQTVEQLDGVAVAEPAVPWARAAAIFAVIGSGLLLGLLMFGDRGLGDRDFGGKMSPEVEISAAELNQAEEELRFALAYFGGIARKAGLALRDDVISERVLDPPRRALQRLNGEPGRDSPELQSSTSGEENL